MLPPGFSWQWYSLHPGLWPALTQPPPAPRKGQGEWDHAMARARRTSGKGADARRGGRGPHWSRRRRWYSTARTVASSTPAAAAPSQRAWGAHWAHFVSFSSSGASACSSGLPDRRSALGPSDTWTLRVSTDVYSFSSGVLSGSASKLLLQLMARSAEQQESGWLSIPEDSTPGLLSSSPEPPLSSLLSAQGELPPALTPVGAGGTGFSSMGLLLLLLVAAVLAGTLLGTELMGILWSGTNTGGTLGGAVPARVELIGNLDGARLVVGTLVDFIPGDVELVGTLEGTVVVNVD